MYKTLYLKEFVFHPKWLAIKKLPVKPRNKSSFQVNNFHITVEARVSGHPRK